MSTKVIITAAAVLLGVSAASADETQYKYDSLGRLVRVEQSAPSGSPSTSFVYDPAGNRTKQVTEGSANGSATSVIVAPLGSGFVVIPIDRQ